MKAITVNVKRAHEANKRINDINTKLQYHLIEIKRLQSLILER